MEKQNGICQITGWKLELPFSTSGFAGNSYARWNIKQASMDRIDHAKKYTKDNIRFVSIVANLARNSFTDDELYEFCEAVHKKRAAATHDS